MDNKAQISLEMLIVIGAIIAVVFILVQSLSGTAKDASDQMNKSVHKLLDEIKDIN